MSAFWIVGIGINIAAMAALLVWAVKAWKRPDSAQERRSERDADTPE